MGSTFAKRFIVPKGRSVRRTPGTMNKTETAYSQTLDQRKLTAEVAAWWYEGITLKLAPDLRWTPDFLVMLGDGSLELHEVKGFLEDHARAKIKVAAQHFPFRIVIVRRKGGKWETEEVGT